ncbi:hypothetical protein TNCV_2690421 [Trichonephila clavipes]|uniref:Uncharacterized protein n=1 Tax=Trichonephila clavipes TaxID=2585209 RepID=A0A8X6VYW5_TRICX|nr:hypothetical protein TNCV_2690421 [Trichonephila clavipes]
MALGTVHVTFLVLRPMILPFIRALRNLTYQQDNARPYVACIVRTLRDTENVQLLPWPARLPDLPPIQYVWSMVAERLARHHMSVTTVELCTVLKLHGHLYMYMPSNLYLTCENPPPWVSPWILRLN